MIHPMVLNIELGFFLETMTFKWKFQRLISDQAEILQGE